MRIRGTETRYDKFSGDWLENQKTKGTQIGVLVYPKTRFCNTCQMRKPKNEIKATKSWKCDDCQKNSAKNK